MEGWPKQNDSAVKTSHRFTSDLEMKSVSGSYGNSPSSYPGYPLLGNNTYNSDKRRVVITGMGVVAPNGRSLITFWNSIRNGISAVGLVTRFDANEMPNRLAAEIMDFDPTCYMDRKTARRSELTTQYGIAAASMAIRDSSLEISSIDADRVGVVEGTTISGMEFTMRDFPIYIEKGMRSITPIDAVNSYCGEGSSKIALELGIKGHAVTYCSGCSSGNDAIGYAYQMINSDDVDVMLAGASDAILMETVYAGFCVLRVMSKYQGKPQEAMRPFSANRDGFVLGEGAAFLVLEELSHALNRGARIYAEILGHGRSCEAYHPTNTHPEGLGFQRSMQKALRRSGVALNEIDYINAHGTATASNDPIETLAIKKVFGDHARRLAISSTKPVTGHTMGAAGAIEAVACALAIHHQSMPPTINLHIPDCDCDLDYLSKGARPYPIRAVMNLNAGFGGKNSCLILSRYPFASSCSTP